ncbi:hypothetical protein O6H91_Y577400 [Diphasiastrum complanatum]|nr:hypothetical protein O6H91_Y577400 [Diphasiastrum complanatum]
MHLTSQVWYRSGDHKKGKDVASLYHPNSMIPTVRLYLIKPTTLGNYTSKSLLISFQNYIDCILNNVGPGSYVSPAFAAQRVTNVSAVLIQSPQLRWSSPKLG